MMTIALLSLPLLGAALLPMLKASAAKKVALAFTVLELLLALWVLLLFKSDGSMQFVVQQPWIPQANIFFSVGIDGINLPLVLLNALLLPVIVLFSFGREREHTPVFYALMLLMQAGMMLVFLALDGFLFYVGWEMALIPVYFLASLWGGEGRVRATFKFFLYTLFGSLLMLVGIVYLYTQMPKTDALLPFYQIALQPEQQAWLFWLFFIAFAIKIPVFPFHTWQPDTYTEADPSATMLLSGIMLKMGLFAIVRWLLPLFPWACVQYADLVMVLCLIGVVYASLIAIRQQDIKRLVAYSSIAHVGLIAAGLFTLSLTGLQGATLQMLSHGINVVGLFLVVEAIERRTGTRQLSELGGIATSAPALAVCFMVLMMGSVALPLTSGFPGELLLLRSLFEMQPAYALVAGTGIILGPVYMMRLYKRSMLGTPGTAVQGISDLGGRERLLLYVLSALVVVLGVLPNLMLQLSEASVFRLLSGLVR